MLLRGRGHCWARVGRDSRRLLVIQNEVYGVHRASFRALVDLFMIRSNPEVLVSVQLNGVIELKCIRSTLEIRSR